MKTRFPLSPKVRHVWRNIYHAEWRDSLNGRRLLSGLFRQMDGKWMSGEANPTGVYGSPLREAVPSVAAALDLAAS